MSSHDIAAALRRMEDVLKQRPQFGLRDDAPATAVWTSGMRVVSAHANGTKTETDMPVALGGTGDRVSPGWLFRASLASCATTCIVMAAAAAGIELTRLEVVAGSRSDTRGLLGMRDEEGNPVFAGPGDVSLSVRIAAAGVSPERLRSLVEESQRCSPIPDAVRRALPVAVAVEVETA
jgi:uncharacterized OsmC-like protein